MLGRAKVGGLSFLALFTALAFGCSGNSNSGSDEEDGDAGDGSGGTSSFGGTTSRGGGAGVLGGGGSGQTTCRSLCERTLACPDQEATDCAAECAALDQEVAAAGCSAASQAFWNCMGALPDVCSLDATQCPAQSDALLACLSGDPGCGLGSMPANSSCSALCPRLDACPDATGTCAVDCAESDAQAAATGCLAEHQALFGCASTCSDVCALGDYDCADEINAYAYCVVAYCSANPNATPCL